MLSSPALTKNRTPAGFRSHIGQDGFEAEAGRYHLYISLACPWANRCLATLYVKVGARQLCGGSTCATSLS